MLNETGPRTALRWDMASRLAGAFQARRSGVMSDVMLTGQPMDLTHAHTTVNPVSPENGTAPRTGTTEWSAKVMGHRVWLSWDWVEVMPQVLVLADPMGIATNAQFHASDGEALGQDAIVLEMNLIVYFLPWQPEVLAAWLLDRRNERQLSWVPDGAWWFALQWPPPSRFPAPAPPSRKRSMNCARPSRGHRPRTDRGQPHLHLHIDASVRPSQWS